MQTPGRGPARHRRPRLSHQVRVGFGSVSLGVAVHVLCGGARLSCLSVPVAATVGMAAALAAGRITERSMAAAASIAATLGAGQYAMHLALSWRVLSFDVTPADADAGTLVLAHGAAAVLLTVSMLGTRTTLRVLGEGVARLRAWLRPSWTGFVLPRPAGTQRRYPVRADRSPAHESTAHPRRGPPVPIRRRPARI